MINYKGTPLFGEDSNPQHTSEFFAIAGTALFWLLFLIFSFVIKPQPKKPEYKEVQIVLSSTPVVQKSEEAPAPAETASASTSASNSEPVVEQIVETPVVESPAVERPAVESPAQKTEPSPVREAPKTVEKKTEIPKTQPKQTTKTTPVQKSEPIEPVLYQDPMEAFAAQTAKKPKQEFDWSQFDDDDDPAETSTASKTNTVQNNTPAFSGIAGTSESVADQKQTSTTSNNNSKSQNASSSTSSALEGIRNTFRGKAVNGVQSETSAKTKTSGSGKIEMEMSNGRARALINPERPVINLSPAAAATIDASITVTISFKVNDKGNVSGVTISPASAFKEIVKQEITGQLLDWLFEPADYSATASFEYKIVKQ